MKKRILSLLMAVVILFQVIPATIQTVVAEDGIEGLSITELVVGKRYSATFDYSKYPDTYVYQRNEEGTIVPYYGTFLKSDLPQDLTIMLLEEGSVYVYVMNEDWPATCSDHRLLDYTELIILECLDPDEPEAPGPSQVSLTVDGEAVSRLVLDPGEKTYILTDLAGEIAQGAASYQWQLMSPDGEWVNIKDYFYPYAIISEALIKNAVNSEGVTYMRCLVSDGMQMLISDPMEVSMKNNAVSYFKMRRLAPTAASAGTGTEVGTDENAGISLASEEETRAGASAFQIAINYVFLHAENEDINGTTAANTFTLTLSTASPFTGDIISPPVVGYRPYVETTGDTFEKDYADKKLVSANTYHFNEQREEVHVTIYYVPKDDISYRVRYFKQNLQNDEYTEWKTSYKTGTADTAVGSGHNPDDEAGFSPLAYDEKAIISSDGGTVIDVYYDRNYYLVKYDLGEGYGVMPSYVRYGTNVMLGNPTNPGYTFDGWQLTAVNGETDNLATTYPQYDVTAANSQINVAHNLTYTAKWKAATTSYTVIYWVENADDNNYTLDSFKVVEGVAPGSSVSATNDLARSDKACFTFNSMLSDKNVIVRGDGTTAVNVYYNRNYYRLTFRDTNRTCTIPTNHVHSIDAGCYEYICAGGHVHDASCSLKCAIEEHQHDPISCNCDVVEHTHSAACCSIPTHVHGDADCDCKITEHTHQTSCYTNQSLTKVSDLEGDSYWDDDYGAVQAYNSMMSRVGTPTNGYVYRYRSSGTNYNFFYLNGIWYYLGTNNTNKGISHDVTNPNNGNPFRSGQANITCNTNEHIHGNGGCACDKSVHDHTSGCNILNCSNGGNVHTHGDGNCNYTCGKNEHAHVASCYNCGQNLHEHTDACQRLICGIPENHTHSNSSDCRVARTIYKKYDADIAAYWPVVSEAGYEYKDSGWWRSNITNNYYTILHKMPEQDIILTFSSASGNTYAWDYALEQLDGSYSVAFSAAVKGSGINLTYAEDYFPITGFTQRDKDVPAFNNRKATLYYTRNSYALTFHDGVSEIHSESILYEADISGKYFVPDIPANKEANSVEFVGWYTTPTCADGTEFNFTGQIMPAGDLTLYAKWVPTIWSVKVYLDEAKSIDLYSDTLLFDAMIAEPNYAAKQNELEAYKNLIFNGWYYNDGGSDIRFDFNTMAIKRDYVIFAKWTSHVPVPFKVRYVIEQDGAYVDVADPTVGVALVGVTKSFTAKAGDELYAEYRKYLPTKRAQSMEIKSIAAENELVFVYQTVETVTYTVKHVFYDPRLSPNPYVISYADTLTCAEGSFSGKLDIPFYTPGDDLQAQAEAAGVWNIITALSPDAYYQELILVPDNSEDKNEIIFEWADRGVAFIYQVIHHFENDGETDTNNPADYTATHYEEFLGTYDDDGNGTVSATAITEQGFSLNYTLSESTKTFNRDDASIGSPRVLNLYYSRNLITYEVQYVTSEGITTETKTAKYQSEVTVNAKDIPGYAPKEESQSATITYNDQLIIFYYDPLEVIFTYQAVGGGSALPVQETVQVGDWANGSTPTPLDGYYFVGWYTDETCTTPVNSSWVESDNTLKPVADAADAGGAVTFYAKFELARLTITSQIGDNTSSFPDFVAGQSFIYRIKGKADTATADISLRVAVPYKNADGSYGSVTIIGLPLGTYDITVEKAWSSWRYTTVDHADYPFKGAGELTIISTLKDADTGLSSGHYITSDAHNS